MESIKSLMRKSDKKKEEIIKRKLEKLQNDETLYDYMWSLQSFNAKSSSKWINNYMFDGVGIEKGKTMNISFHDVQSK